MSTKTTLPALLRGFFETYLAGQRDVSPNTIFAYRDSIKLLLRFAARRAGRQVIRLQVDDLGPTPCSPFSPTSRPNGRTARPLGIAG